MRGLQKSWVVLLVLVLLAASAASSYGDIVAGMISPGPGCNYPIEGTNGLRVDYGYGRFQAPAWTVANGVATTTGTNEAILMATLENAPEQASSITVMPDTEDWVFEIKHRVNGMTNTANGTGWVLKRWMSGIDEDDYPIAGLFKTSNTSDQWQLTGGGHFLGQGAPRYQVLVDGMTLGDGVWHTWKVHYRAAQQCTDTYMDGALIASDVTRLDGVFSANMIKIESLRGTSTHEVDYAILGQVVPEPHSIVLCGIGLLGFLAYAWRKRK